MPNGSVSVALLVLIAAPLAAQSEAELKAYFEGKTVTVKLDMPATDDGVDLYPGHQPAIEFSKYAARIKKYGAAVHAGDPIIVTKVKVKDKLIEFQLGGGGFGTFWDNTSTSVNLPSAPKTQREKNLEQDLKTATDPAKRRAITEELDGLRKDREREDARNQAIAAEAEEKKRENLRQQAQESGSRFNLRYSGNVPAEALTPEAVMQALADYVDFTGRGSAAEAATSATSMNCPPMSTGVLSLRKGLTLQETEALLGRPEQTGDRKEGNLKVTTAVYTKDQSRIEAEFVEGVLVRYSITSN